MKKVYRKISYGNIIEDLIIWCTGGLFYFYLEIAFRNYSHYSMIICGGLCFLLVGRVGRKIIIKEDSIWKMIFKIMLYGGLIITSLEFITGVLVNMIFDMNVWSYSGLRYNLYGQICLLYSLLWSLLSLVCVYIEGLIRTFIFETKNKSDLK
ncbi:MAG: hypothetical protein IJV15_09575 [Lachnospiraceae bacterium]|nr:hypothetical protein [Lachnospiraceae bacterium]